MNAITSHFTEDFTEGLLGI